MDKNCVKTFHFACHSSPSLWPPLPLALITDFTIYTLKCFGDKLHVCITVTQKIPKQDSLLMKNMSHANRKLA